MGTYSFSAWLYHWITLLPAQEVEALEALANAFRTLIKTAGMKLLKVGILKHTVLASLMGALSPVAWLQIGKIIGESGIRIIVFS
jgi:Protein of unknown function (DUF726)